GSPLAEPPGDPALGVGVGGAGEGGELGGAGHAEGEEGGVPLQRFGVVELADDGLGLLVGQRAAQTGGDQGPGADGGTGLGDGLGDDIVATAAVAEAHQHRPGAGGEQVVVALGQV